MTQKTFAQFLQVGEATLSSIYSGRTRPTLNIIEAIKNKLPAVSTDWLLFGIGQMYSDDKSIADDAMNSQQSSGQMQTLAFQDFPPSSSGVPNNASAMPGVNNTLKNDVSFFPKNFDKTPRKITEIRIFYDDQTWETFVAKK